MSQEPDPATRAVNCPSAETLQQLLAGGLDDSATELVSQHLEQCRSCRDRAAALPDDGLLAALRRAEPAPETARTSPTLSRRLADVPRTERLGSPPATVSARKVVSAGSPRELGTIGRFRLIREMGRGGMGVVYLAFDEKLRRQTALKVLLPEWHDHPEVRQRFEREARALAQLDHPRIVRILETSEALWTADSQSPPQMTPYLVMPVLTGESLGQRLRQRGSAARMPVVEIKRLGRQIAEALAVVHGAGLVHRDIKPDNIWLCAPSDDVVLLDFSVARADDADPLTETGVSVGTPGYMPPARAEGPPDPRDDLYSLGVLLHRLACGLLPSDGLTDRNVPPELAPVIARLLTPHRDDQYPNAQSVAEDLASSVSIRKRGLAVCVALGLIGLASWLYWFGPFARQNLATTPVPARDVTSTIVPVIQPGGWVAPLLPDTNRSPVKGLAIAVDARSSVYIAGSTIPANGDIPEAADAVIAAFTAEREVLWRRVIGGRGDDQASCASIGPDGNLVVAGWFSQTVDFGHEGSQPASLTAAGATDAFVLKLTPRGELIWIRQFGGTSEFFDQAHALCIDGANRVTVVGHFAGALMLDGKQLATSRVITDACVLQFDGSGELLWSRALGSDTNELESANSVAVDDRGNLTVCGRLGGTVGIPKRAASAAAQTTAEKPDSVTLETNGRGAFVMRLTSSGTLQWVRNLGTSGENVSTFEIITAVSTTPRGDCTVLAGTFQGDKFESGDGQPAQNFGEFDAFVTLLDEAGGTLWTRTFGGAGDDRVLGVLVEPSGQVHAAGFFNETTNFAGASEPPQVCISRGPPTPRAGAGFLLNLSPEGTFASVSLVQGPEPNAAAALAAGPSGVIATGWLTAPAELIMKGPDGTSQTLNTNRPVAAFVLCVPPRE